MHFSVVFLFVLCGVAYSKVLNLSCNNIRTFVDGHNSRRLQLARGEVPGQPAASEMRKMVWDDELAAKAANWASRNAFKANPDKSIGSGRFETGENIFLYSTRGSNHILKIDNTLKFWFDEYKNCDFGPLTRSHIERSKKKVFHYTQMAWANTVYVGCAISQYRSGNNVQSLVVCYYGPRGNILGETPYETDQGARQNLVCGTSEYECSRPYGDRC